MVVATSFPVRFRNHPGKKSMRSPNTLALLAAAALALTAGCSSEDPGSDGEASGGEQMTVIYEATGTGTADLRYSDVSTARVRTEDGVALPWKVEITGGKTDFLSFSVSGNAEEQEVGCVLTVDGETISSDRSPYSIAECQFGKP